MNMYPQMETPGGTCTPKQKYEWACWRKFSTVIACKRNRFDFWKSCKRLQNFETWKPEAKQCETISEECGSTRSESSRPWSTRPGNISAWSYFAYFFHKGCQY